MKVLTRDSVQAVWPCVPVAAPGSLFVHTTATKPVTSCEKVSSIALHDLFSCPSLFSCGTVTAPIPEDRLLLGQ